MAWLMAEDMAAIRQPKLWYLYICITTTAAKHRKPQKYNLKEKLHLQMILAQIRLKTVQPNRFGAHPFSASVC